MKRKESIVSIINFIMRWGHQTSTFYVTAFLCDDFLFLQRERGSIELDATIPIIYIYLNLSYTKWFYFPQGSATKFWLVKVKNTSFNIFANTIRQSHALVL